MNHSPESSLMPPILTLCQREMLAFWRKKSRIVGALGTPIVFWLLIGSGLRHSVRLTGSSAGSDYLTYAFPGTIVLVLLFTTIFSMISVIEDRKSGFMQAVLVAPIHRLAVVGGKVLGCSALAVAQGVLLLVLSPLMGISFSALTMVATLGALILISVELSSLGFRAAWPMDSTQGFHAVMNLVLMPMWLLSGAFFPASGASTWIRWIMMVNPLTYGVATLRYAMYGGGMAHAGMPSLPLALGVTLLFTVVMIGLSCRAVAKKR